MEEYHHNLKQSTCKVVVTLAICFTSFTLHSEDFKLPPKETKLLKESFRYIESLEQKKIRINKKIYDRYSNFESIFHFRFSGKKISIWVKTRIKSYSLGATGDFVAFYQNGEVVLGKQFFKLNKLDRFIVILHEARHADGKDSAHIICPEDFPYLNPRDINIVPAGKKGCDSIADGGYGISASFIFELAAFGYMTQTESAYRYNSEISRIILE